MIQRTGEAASVSQVRIALALPVTALAERFSQPPIGPTMRPYERTRSPSNHRPLAW
jgi:hypothetical protein